MTWEQALTVVKSKMEYREGEDCYSISPASLLSLFKDLGVLKFDGSGSAETVEEKFGRVVSHLGVEDLDLLCVKINRHGLKIVEK